MDCVNSRRTSSLWILRSLLAEQFEKRHHDISLPVISMETVIYLGDKLQGMGIKKAFHSSEADLSQITRSRNKCSAIAR